VQNAAPGRPGPGRSGQLIVTISAYALLFVLGALQGVIGCFYYAGTVGPVPAAALAFAVVVFGTTALAGWGMQTPTAGLMSAVGWFAASFVLAMATPGGSVVITNTAAGKWFLYGGAAGAAAGVVVAFAATSRSRPSGSRPSRAGPSRSRSSRAGR
jgi:prepilin signal peptidase PulO-like enzyme (type II secretory pathway)